MKNNIVNRWKPIIAYLFVWLVMCGVFRLFCPGGEMAYWMITFWAVLPLAAIVTAYKAGKNVHWTAMQIVLLTVFYGAMYMLIRCVTFEYYRTIGTSWYLLIPGMLFFVFGFVIGRGTVIR